jgi:hypothetical protein
MRKGYGASGLLAGNRRERGKAAKLAQPGLTYPPLGGY